MTRRKWFLIVAIAALVFVTLACGANAPQSQPQPPASTNPADQMHYSVQDLYNEAQQVAATVVTDRVHTRAWLWGIAIVLVVIAAGIGLSVEGAGWAIVIIIALTLGLIGGVINLSQIPGRVDQVGHDLANEAITKGVDLAQRAQATNYQYIHAVISEIHMDVEPCRRTVNSHDFCSANTRYYTHREINSHMVCVSQYDSKGNYTGESCHEEHDDEYTPWFTEVVRYWFVPDTRAKYLSEQIYHQQCLADDGSIQECSRDEYGNINDKRKPVVYASSDWRAPEDAQAHVFCETGFFGTSCEKPGQYNNHVPDAWNAVKQAKLNGGSVVDATFVGPYFNYGFAADSPLYDVYTGHYDDLRSVVSLPGPSGATFNIVDAYGKPSVLYTQLLATDDDIAIGFNPIFVIGGCVNSEQLAGYTDKAMQVQGDFGPSKQGSLRWFLVCDSVVTRLGGMPNTVSAVKAYLRDSNVWGLFSMPKNLVITVSSISDDGTSITGRALETGMPAGNVTVISRVAGSIPAGTSLPLTPENLFGVFSANYVATGAEKFEYVYSDLAQAGSVVGYLYENDPNYTPPDPSSPECTLAKADHVGFVRYSTCNTDFLKTTIQVNEDGRFLIMSIVSEGAQKATPVASAWFVFGLSIVILGMVIFGKSQEY